MSHFFCTQWLPSGHHTGPPLNGSFQIDCPLTLGSWECLPDGQQAGGQGTPVVPCATLRVRSRFLDSASCNCGTMTRSGHSFISFKVFLCIFLAVSLLHIFLWSLWMGFLWWKEQRCVFIGSVLMSCQTGTWSLGPGVPGVPKDFAVRTSVGWACLPPGLENTKHSRCPMLSVRYKKLPDSSFWN